MRNRYDYPQAYFVWRPWGYKLKVLTNAWNLGGSVTTYYYSYPARKSIFSFRKEIRDEGLFRNKVAEKRKGMENWAKFKKLMGEN